MAHDDEQLDDEVEEPTREDVVLMDTELVHRIVVPRAWGSASLLGTSEVGMVLLYWFSDMPHALTWRLPEEVDVVIEIITDDDPRAREEVDEEGTLQVWHVPADIDSEHVRYPSDWGAPTPIVDAWLDGGPLLVAFADGQHTLRWELGDDVLLALIADDSQSAKGGRR